MFFFAYNFLLFLLSPLLFPLIFLRALLKGKDVRFYFKRLYFTKRISTKTVHLHGVSVGEVLSLKPLVKRLKEKDCETSISVGTSSGLKVAKKSYENATSLIFPAPYELLFSVNSFVKRISPALFIIVEAEFWFNLFYLLKKKKIPIWIVNFRIGNERNYKRFSFYYKKVFSMVDMFFVPEKRYVDFLSDFGVNRKRIKIIGNLKADVVFEKISEEKKRNLKEELKIDSSRRVFVCGSTTDGEEELLLKEYEKHKKDWQMIIAPRHIERSKEIFEKIKNSSSLKALLKTEIKNSNEYDVLILNTIGELFSVYSIADLAFVGGSLKPVGGHNILEPIFHGVPVITGKYYENFKDLVEKLKEKEGIIIIENEKEISFFLNKRSEELTGMGEKGLKVLESMQGGSDTIIKEIERELGSC